MTSAEVNVTVTLVNTGSVNLQPKQILYVVPSGTNLVSGTWVGYFYSSGGSLECVLHSIPPGCTGQGSPDTTNGGTIRVTFLVTSAHVGESLTLTYSITFNGQTSTDSITFTVA